MKTQLLKTSIPSWLNGIARVYSTNVLSPYPVTSSFVFIMNPDKTSIALITNKRGLDLPGGHADPGETDLETIIRETKEETSLTLTPDMLERTGFINIEQKPTPKYPAKAAQTFWTTTLPNTTPLTPTLEIEKAEWYPITQALETCKNRIWYPLLLNILKTHKTTTEQQQTTNT